MLDCAKADVTVQVDFYLLNLIQHIFIEFRVEKQVCTAIGFATSWGLVKGVFVSPLAKTRINISRVLVYLSAELFQFFLHCKSLLIDCLIRKAILVQ